MEGLHVVAPVCLGRYYPSVLRGLVAQHWYLLGLLLEYRVLPSGVVILPKPSLLGEAFNGHG